jgi:N-acetylglucosamine-6-phosphate deacetylase
MLEAFVLVTEWGRTIRKAVRTTLAAEQGVRVSAGHCNPSLDELRAAIDAGLSLFTHLGNGCPMQMHRHDNIIQRVLSLADSLCISFIADGHHVPTFVLKNFLTVVPEDKIIIVSDAISAARLGPGEYQLSGQTIFVDDAGASWSADRMHFAGSAATLKRMHEVLRGMGFEAARIDRWMRDNPQRLLERGR